MVKDVPEFIKGLHKLMDETKGNKEKPFDNIKSVEKVLGSGFVVVTEVVVDGRKLERPYRVVVV